MHIRCERCSTLYELEESLLAPEGSQVQCSRCEHVFTARRVAVPAPAAPPGEAPAPTPPPVTRTPPPVAQGPRAPASEARASRSAQTSVYRPPPSAPSVRTNPVLRRDAVGAFEARLRRAARVRWIVPIVAVAVLLLVGAAALAYRLRGQPSTSRVRTEALALIALDDAESLDRAVAQLDDAMTRAPKLHALAADRVLAQVLRASALVDERDALAAQLAARRAEQQGPDGAAGPPGDPDAVQPLERDVRAVGERAQALARAAQDALAKLERELGDDASVRRDRALQEALAGDRERALREVAKARAVQADEWVELAEAVAIARGPDAGAAERALGKVTVAHPKLVRARYLLARAQTAIGRRGEARTTLDALLAANPRHEGGKRLRDALSAPRADAVAPEIAPPTGDPDGNGPPPQRKPVAQRAAPTGSRSTEGGRPEAPAAKVPAVADGAAPAPPVPVASPAAARSRRAGALAPAALPEPAPASGAPEVAPPRVFPAPPPAARELRGSDDGGSNGG